MSKKSKDPLTNVPINKVRKHNLEYFNDSNFETKDINEVTSLLLDSHKTYNGRRFLNDDDSKCVLPSDKIELESGTAILDVGCGPGLWTIDMGLKYPSSLIIAIDINSSNFPSSEECPSNVCYLACNAIHGIPFPPSTFDFVNISLMWSAFTEEQWIIVIKELVRVLKHDGWIEFTEPDPMSKNCGENLTWLLECFSNACRDIRGVNINIYEKIPKYSKEMDVLEDLRCLSLDYPLGEWYGCFGEYAVENFKRMLQGVVFLPKYMGISNEKFNDLLNDYVEEANKNEASFI
ncbi:18579_t:CDS:2, partial [Dentiscutata erythropus]